MRVTVTVVGGRMLHENSRHFQPSVFFVLKGFGWGGAFLKQVVGKEIGEALVYCLFAN